MNRLLPLAPLLSAFFVLAVGNGLLLTLVTLRASIEGFSPTMIGALGTAYFLGFLTGARYSPPLIDGVGHVRVFAALAALIGAAVLIQSLIVRADAWLVLRFISGFCMAGLFTTVESWLNGATENRDRGRVLGIYSLIDLLAQTGSQLILPLVGPESSDAFIITGVFLTICLVPIALSPSNVQIAPSAGGSSIFSAFRISPQAFVTCLAAGMTIATFRTVGPLYATQVGFDVNGIALFLTAAIIGGAVLQLPLGFLSDRMDRRFVMLIASVGATVACLYVGTLSGDMFDRNPLGTVIRTGTDPTYYIIGGLLFGAFSFPLYALAVAHANDFATPGQFSSLAAGLLFTFGIGAAGGPIVASALIGQFGPASMFIFLGAVHVILIVATVLRIAARAPVADDDKAQFTPLPRSTAGVTRLARLRLMGGAPAANLATNQGAALTPGQIEPDPVPAEAPTGADDPQEAGESPLGDLPEASVVSPTGPAIEPQEPQRVRDNDRLTPGQIEPDPLPAPAPTSANPSSNRQG